MSVKEMVKNELDKLPDNLAVDVYNFVLFLENKNEKQSIVNAAQSSSEVVFQKVWDNEEDAIYDTL